jgi:hypothetical protein
MAVYTPRPPADPVKKVRADTFCEDAHIFTIIFLRATVPHRSAVWMNKINL